MKFRVSVILATYGDPKWQDLAMERAFESCRGQGAYEIIPVHVTNGSLSESRNFGASKADGSHLLFVDADDELTANYVAAMHNAYATVTSVPWKHDSPWHSNPLLVPRVQYVHADGREQPPTFPNRHAPIEELNHCVIGTLIPRGLFYKIGGFPDLPIYEDWAAFLACKRAGAEFADVHAAVYRAHLREGSRNDGREAYDIYWQIRRAHEEEMKKNGS